MICSLTHICVIGGSVSAASASPPAALPRLQRRINFKNKRETGEPLSLSASALFCAVGGYAAYETELKLLRSFYFARFLLLFSCFFFCFFCQEQHALFELTLTEMTVHLSQIDTTPYYPRDIGDAYVNKYKPKHKCGVWQVQKLG